MRSVTFKHEGLLLLWSPDSYDMKTTIHICQLKLMEVAAWASLLKETCLLGIRNRTGMNWMKTISPPTLWEKTERCARANCPLSISCQWFDPGFLLGWGLLAGTTHEPHTPSSQHPSWVQTHWHCVVAPHWPGTIRTSDSAIARPSGRLQVGSSLGFVGFIFLQDTVSQMQPNQLLVDPAKSCYQYRIRTRKLAWPCGHIWEQNNYMHKVTTQRRLVIPKEKEKNPRWTWKPKL